MPDFTERQIECLRLVAEGITTSKAIANRTGLSTSSVDNYLSRAAVLLGAADRREAAARFLALEADRTKSSVSPSVSRFSSVFRWFWLCQLSLAAGVRWLLRPPPVGGEQHDLSKVEITLLTFKVALIGLAALCAIILLMVGLLWALR